MCLQVFNLKRLGIRPRNIHLPALHKGDRQPIITPVTPPILSYSGGDHGQSPHRPILTFVSAGTMVGSAGRKGSAATSNTVGGGFTFASTASTLVSSNSVVPNSPTAAVATPSSDPAGAGSGGFFAYKFPMTSPSASVPPAMATGPNVPTSATVTSTAHAPSRRRVNTGGTLASSLAGDEEIVVDEPLGTWHPPPIWHTAVDEIDMDDDDHSPPPKVDDHDQEGVL